MTAYTDLIARLRKVRRDLETCRPVWTDQYEFLTEQAADEIERLRSRLACVTQTLAPLVDDDNRPVEALARHAVARLAEAEALLREARADSCIVTPYDLQPDSEMTSRIDAFLGRDKP